MSKLHGCPDDSDVIARFTDALEQRIGSERFRLWFGQVRFEVRPAGTNGRPVIAAIASAQFAADRLSNHFTREMRGAAGVATGQTAEVLIEAVSLPKQAPLPFAAAERLGEEGGGPKVLPRPTKPKHSGSERGGVQSLAQTIQDGRNRRQRPNATETKGEPGNSELKLSSPPADSHDGNASPSAEAGRDAGNEPTWESFIAGTCNELARGACRMAVESPSTASPLVLWGPAGSGKSHLLRAVASKLRSAQRMRRVVYLSAEQFTNDFLKSLYGSSLPAFRARFRDADALLIDDIHFFVDKKATVRELHHTVEMLAERGKPLLFAGIKTPSEIKGLGSELAGRLASGLVCQIGSLDLETRRALLRRYVASRCPHSWPEETLGEVAEAVVGDGRVLSGIANSVSLLQRMDGAMPSMDRIRNQCGHLLRASGTPVTLSTIERAVERLFQLDSKSLCSGSQVKKITEPRMLAMYLSRELTSSAFSEIGSHYGGRSHSTAILANQRVRQWRESGRPIGKGPGALSADEAIRQIESILKIG